MKKPEKYKGVVVPVVTPSTAANGLDELALGRMVDWLLAGGVEGVFVLGTTGEGIQAPKPLRCRVIELAAQQAKKRGLIYAGLGDLAVKDFSAVNEYFRAGADVLVAHPPVSNPVPAGELAGWFRQLLDSLKGPLILYNMPAIANVSIPLDAVEQLLGHPNLAGIKDSENNPKRHEELLRRFRGRPDFSVFVGVGALMEQGLKLGADGIVPSVGNLVPDACHKFYDAAGSADLTEAAKQISRMNSVAALYQTGRNLGQSLAALKAALSCLGLCSTHVFPPLVALAESEIKTLRNQMHQLRLLD